MNKVSLSPDVKVVFPGPNTEKFLSRSAESICGQSHGLVVIEENGAFVRDIDRNVYLDFAELTNSVGYCHPRVVDAVSARSQSIRPEDQILSYLHP